MDPIFVAQLFDHGIEEFQVAIFLIPLPFLPTGSPAFRIRQPSRGVESLHIDRHSLRPMPVYRTAAGRIRGTSAVTVENEYKGGDI